MALMPLPTLESGGPITSTWGGTMLGIAKKTRDPDLAWELAMHLYYDASQLGDRFRSHNILPPLRDAWRQPAFTEPRPYWSNLPIGTLYASIADQTPPQYTSPYIEVAKGKLGEALAESVSYYKRHGDDGFDTFVAEVLKSKADDVRTVVHRNVFQ